jgi:hypothetical protein
MYKYLFYPDLYHNYDHFIIEPITYGPYDEHITCEYSRTEAFDFIVECINKVVVMYPNLEIHFIYRGNKKILHTDGTFMINVRSVIEWMQKVCFPVQKPFTKHSEEMIRIINKYHFDNLDIDTVNEYDVPNDWECSICLEDTKTNVLLFPCNKHYFHYECISRACMNKIRCALCRYEL